jgi:hypothetical protein
MRIWGGVNMHVFDDNELPEFVVYPDQLVSRQNINSPEKMLMLAVLESALRSIIVLRAKELRFLPVKKERLREDLQWLVSEDEKWPFSFVNICEALELDSDYLRKLILETHPIPEKTAA